MAPKAPLDFQALLGESALTGAYRALNMPVLILRGEHAPMPTRVIADGLSELLPASRLMIVGGAGHMGPLTHAPEVCALMVQHIAASETKAGASSRRWRPRRLADMLSQTSRPAEDVP